jgi:DNA-directed RNA polymerase subunit RPC12/RpoP
MARKMQPRKIDSYSKEEFEKAVKGTQSKLEVIDKLGWKMGGNAYYNLNYLSAKFNISLPSWQMTGASTTAAIAANTIPDDAWFVKGKLRSGSNSKKRLIKSGTPNLCSNPDCDLKGKTVWSGKPVPFEVDHIDGDRLNNTRDNLRILCAMCHKQTDTHGGRNIKISLCPCGKKVYGNIETENLCIHSEDGTYKKYECIDCGKELKPKHKPSRCASCNGKHAVKIQLATTRGDWKFEYPSVNEVIAKVRDLGFLQYSLELGVSDNAIRKYLKRNGVTEMPKKMTLEERSQINYQ